MPKNITVKTTAHLPRRPAPAPEPTHHDQPSTARLGLLVSLFAAVAAIVVHALTDLPAAAIIVPVIVIGFTLSWFATGHREHHDDASPR
ncbi:MAG: hypothetical protein ABWZ99_06110 [Ilumatobacteraceae bacterium]